MTGQIPAEFAVLDSIRNYLPVFKDVWRLLYDNKIDLFYQLVKPNVFITSINIVDNWLHDPENPRLLMMEQLVRQH